MFFNIYSNHALDSIPDEFTDAVKKLYHDNGDVIEGDDLMPDGDSIPYGTPRIPLKTIGCQVQAMIDTCNYGCTLSIVIEGTAPNDSVKGVETAAEQIAFAKSMTSAFKIALPDEEGNCTDTLMRRLGGHDTRAYARSIVAQLNDSLWEWRRHGADTLSAEQIFDSIKIWVGQLTFGDTSCQDWYDVIEAKASRSGPRILSIGSDSGCCPGTDPPELFSQEDRIIFAKFFLVDSCSLGYKRWCLHDSVVFLHIDTLCTNICVDSCAPDLCFAWVPSVRPDITDTLHRVTCEEELCRSLRSLIATQIEDCADYQAHLVEAMYADSCAVPENIEDEFTISYEVNLYHFTLFYYDRAGNLIRTIPPNGVDLSSTSRMDHPSHTNVTRYSYNSLKQLLSQRTPDAGTTTFIYDDKGEMRFSVSARQAAMNPMAYSYMKYDKLGRVREVGEAMVHLVGGALVTPAFMSYANDQGYPWKGQRYFTMTGYTSAATFPGYINISTKTQRYLRNRISSTVTESGVQTIYSYDPHGNVEWMASYIPRLGWNYVRYDYDLISNNVLKVYYDEGMHDQFTQRYSYDADNRLLKVESSRDQRIWDRDASYEYYAHGPLRRTELGEDSLQGMDYVYTIEGWLKGMNHPTLGRPAVSGGGGGGSTIPPADPSLDGLGTSGYAPDAYGMVLGYYAGDYLRRRGTSTGPGNSSPYNSLPGASGYVIRADNLNGTYSLYNGNISSWHMKSQTSPTAWEYPGQTGYKYHYDQLNRLLTADFQAYDSAAKSWGAPGDYSESFTYDPNGNIKSAYRTVGGSLPLVMDNLTYHYQYQQTGTAAQDRNNQLQWVSEGSGTSSANFTEDIDNQTHPWPGPSPYTENYVYDASGNLLIDQQEGLIIKWNPYGKIEEVRKNLPSISQTTKFWYNAAGNRVKKQVINNLHLDDSLSQITYYVRDANEQVLAIYDQLSHDTLGTSNCTQQVGATGDGDGDGVPNSGCDLCTGAFDPWQNDYDRDGTPDLCDPCPFKSGTTCAGDTSWVAYQPPSNPWNVVSTKLAELMVYGNAGYGRIVVMKPDTLRDTTALVTDTYTRRIGKKEYELKDHLGNVRVVISDIKLNWSTIASPIFRAKIVAENSYYAFGMLQPGQVYQSGGHRYGFNGKEQDDEMKGTGASYDYGMRMYDARLGRFMSVDPLAPKYPELTPYQFASNTPIQAVDLDGLEAQWVAGLFNIGWYKGKLAMVSVNETNFQQRFPVAFQQWKDALSKQPGWNPLETQDRYLVWQNEKNSAANY